MICEHYYYYYYYIHYSSIIIIISIYLLLTARDVNASPTDQWNEARGHWDQTMQLWREAAANNGIAVATGEH